jgi:hypothetical protein
MRIIHLRVQRWVILWIYVGVVCGAIAVVNILGHHVTRAEDRLFLIVGVAHWLLGGIVCWAFEGVKVEPERPSPQPPFQKPLNAAPGTEWHPASDFLLPGARQSLLPWRH